MILSSHSVGIFPKWMISAIRSRICWAPSSPDWCFQHISYKEGCHSPGISLVQYKSSSVKSWQADIKMQQCLGRTHSTSAWNLAMQQCLGRTHSTARREIALQQCLGRTHYTARREIAMQQCLGRTHSTARRNIAIQQCLGRTHSTARRDIAIQQCLGRTHSTARRDIAIQQCPDRTQSTARRNRHGTTLYNRHLSSACPFRFTLPQLAARVPRLIERRHSVWDGTRQHSHVDMSSSHKNSLRITGLLWGKLSDHRRSQRTSNAELWWLFFHKPEQALEQTVELLIWVTITVMWHA